MLASVGTDKLEFSLSADKKMKFKYKGKTTEISLKDENFNHVNIRGELTPKMAI